MAVSKITRSQTNNDVLMKLNEIINALGIKSLTVDDNILTWVDQDDVTHTAKIQSVKLVVH